MLKGDVLGLSSATHLHFEYVPNGKLFATKKRIDAGDCVPAYVPPATPSPEQAASSPTGAPSKSPLVPPETHPPTPAPTLYLPTGSITVRDSGQLADDSFAVEIDGFRLCETAIGELNTCAVNFIRPGRHELTLRCLVAPDGYGTYNVRLSDGWLFSDLTTEKDDLLQGEGNAVRWNFTVPLKPP